MLPHDSADLRAIDERRREMGMEVRAMMNADKLKTADKMRQTASGTSREIGSSAEKPAIPWRAIICAECGKKLEALGKQLVSLGKRLRDAAGTDEGEIVSPGF